MLSRLLKIKSLIFISILFIEIIFVNQLTELFTGIASHTYESYISYQEIGNNKQQLPSERRKTAPELRKYVQNQSKNSLVQLFLDKSPPVLYHLPDLHKEVKDENLGRIVQLQLDQRRNIGKFYIYFTLSSEGSNS